MHPDILLGDCLAHLKNMEAGSIDSLITDPPAGINFMGKGWDKDKGGRDHWITWMNEIMVEALRVLKPGAHGFVWALPRTSHWTATALENAGFEIRDIVTHIFGSGFPKNHDVSKSIDKMAGAERKSLGSGPYSNKGRTSTHNSMSGSGTISENETITAPATPEAKKHSGWGSALKPSNEHWILIRKPLEKNLTIAKNVLKYGTGAINIDASRIDGPKRSPGFKRPDSKGIWSGAKQQGNWDASQGRFPANTIVDEGAVGDLDEQSLAGGMHSAGKARIKDVASDYDASSFNMSGTRQMNRVGDSGGASRFFYCPKAPKKDKGAENKHPTVKNTKLMSYLIKMITPVDGVVLDPFMGSGSTGVAALRDGFKFIGIEKEREYFDIAKSRLSD